MFEHHDHPDDEHDHVPPPDTDPPHDPGADAFAEQHLPPLGDLPAHADAPPELHFPGDESAADVAADLDPAAPWPDDADFAQWLAGHEDTTGADGPPEQLPAAPEVSDALPSSDELVDWTLRRLGEDDEL
jgi:hypothetical protein